MIVKFISVCAVFCLAAICSALSQDRQDRDFAEICDKLGLKISQAGKHTLGVVGISNTQGYGVQFSDYLDDKLSIFLFAAGKRLESLTPGWGFRVVTRSRLTQIMEERRLKYGANFDKAAFLQIGKLAGADAILAGSYQVHPSDVEINLQVLDVSTGTIVDSGAVRIPRTADVDAVLGRPAVTGTPGSADPGKASVQPGAAFRLPPPESVHPAEVFNATQNSIGSYKCRKNPETIVCYFVVTRLWGGNEDYDPRGSDWNSKLVDNFNIEHPLTHSYFVNGRGGEQRTLNFGKGDTAWLAQEFSGVSPDIRSARVVFTNFHSQLHASVE